MSLTFVQAAAQRERASYKTHYYGSHRSINPAGIVPIGPVLDFTAPQERAMMQAS